MGFNTHMAQCVLRIGIDSHIRQKRENRIAIGQEMFIGLEGGEPAALVQRHRQQELIGSRS